jgi:hypothetical protein
MPKRALLIGINYKKGRRVLRGCANDVAAMEKMLMTYQYSVTKLIDEQATYANIIAEFTKLLSEAESGDSLFFQFSGHGNHIVDANHDEVDGYDEYLLTDDLYGITDDTLRKIIIKNLKADVQLFALFDSCVNGTIFDLKYNSYLMTSIDIPETMSNVFAISSSSDFQNSLEKQNGDAYEGAGTWAFAQVMETNREPFLMDVVKQMRTLLVSKGFRQYPQLSWGKKIDIDNFRLVL